MLMIGIAVYVFSLFVLGIGAKLALMSGMSEHSTPMESNKRWRDPVVAAAVSAMTGAMALKDGEETVGYKFVPSFCPIRLDEGKQLPQKLKQRDALMAYVEISCDALTEVTALVVDRVRKSRDDEAKKMLKDMEAVIVWENGSLRFVGNQFSLGMMYCVVDKPLTLWVTLIAALLAPVEVIKEIKGNTNAMMNEAILAMLGKIRVHAMYAMFIRNIWHCVGWRKLFIEMDAPTKLQQPMWFTRFVAGVSREPAEAERSIFPKMLDWIKVIVKGTFEADEELAHTTDFTPDDGSVYTEDVEMKSAAATKRWVLMPLKQVEDPIDQGDGWGQMPLKRHTAHGWDDHDEESGGSTSKKMKADDDAAAHKSHTTNWGSSDVSQGRQMKPKGSQRSYETKWAFDEGASAGLTICDGYDNQLIRKLISTDEKTWSQPPTPKRMGYHRYFGYLTKTPLVFNIEAMKGLKKPAEMAFYGTQPSTDHLTALWCQGQSGRSDFVEGQIARFTTDANAVASQLTAQSERVRQGQCDPLNPGMSIQVAQIALCAWGRRGDVYSKGIVFPRSQPHQLLTAWALLYPYETLLEGKRREYPPEMLVAAAQYVYMVDLIEFPELKSAEDSAMVIMVRMMKRWFSLIVALNDPDVGEDVASALSRAKEVFDQEDDIPKWNCDLPQVILPTTCGLGAFAIAHSEYLRYECPDVPGYIAFERILYPQSSDLTRTDFSGTETMCAALAVLPEVTRWAPMVWGTKRAALPAPVNSPWNWLLAISCVVSTRNTHPLNVTTECYKAGKGTFPGVRSSPTVVEERYHECLRVMLRQMTGCVKSRSYILSIIQQPMREIVDRVTKTFVADEVNVLTQQEAAYFYAACQYDVSEIDSTTAQEPSSMGITGNMSELMNQLRDGRLSTDVDATAFLKNAGGIVPFVPLSVEDLARFKTLRKNDNKLMTFKDWVLMGEGV